MAVRRLAFLFCLLAGLLAAQTKIDYNTQIKNAPQFFGTPYTGAYTPATYSPLTYEFYAPFGATGKFADNHAFPAPIQATIGTIASPVENEVPGIFCEIVGDTGAPTSNQNFADPSAQPGCIKAYAIAVNNAGSAGGVANVMPIVGIAQTNGGCKNPGGSPCNANSVGGIGIGGFSYLNTDNAVSWGAWFAANDEGFHGGLTGVEIDTFLSATNRTLGNAGGLVVVDVDNTGGTQSVVNDEGIASVGYGKGFVYTSGGLPGNDFNAFYIDARGSAAGNAGTTVLGFQSGQLGPFKVGLDFTNATFTDSAIKNASIKQAQFLSGVTNGTGFQHFSACTSNCTVTVTPCTTSATAGATCTNSITLPVAMADNAYQASCSGQAIASGSPTLYIAGKTSGTAISIGTMAVTAAASAFGEIDCQITHN